MVTLICPPACHQAWAPSRHPVSHWQENRDDQSSVPGSSSPFRLSGKPTHLFGGGSVLPSPEFVRQSGASAQTDNLLHVGRESGGRLSSPAPCSAAHTHPPN
jgi:hypothetical protein